MKHSEHMPAIQWLWSVAGKIKRNILLLSLLQVLLGVFAVLFAWLLRQTIDAAVAADAERFYRFALLLTAIAAVQLALRALKRFLDEHTRSHLENAVKERLFAALLSREYSAVTAVHSQEWMNRLTTDTAVAAEGMTMLLPEMVGMAVRLLGALAMVMVLLPRLGWLLLCGTAVMPAVAIALRGLLRRRQQYVREADGKVRIALSERLRSLLTVRIFAAEEEAIQTARKTVEGHHEARMSANGVNNLSTTGLGVVIHGFYLAAVFLCGHGLLDGSVSYGSFAAVLQLVGLIQSPLATGSTLVPKAAAMVASAQRLMEAESLPPAREEKVLGLSQVQAYYDNEFSALCMNNVTFRYPGENGAESRVVLRGLHMTIPKGAFAVVTGPSGTGKSTLLKLLMGIYKPEVGQCCLKVRDGQMMEITGQFVRMFAYVPQGNLLMHGPIREILTLGCPEKRADDEALWTALRLSCVEYVIRQLPGGLDTVLGEQGTGLSEGQLQRLAIARAICAERPVLILDEATSALDGDTERRVLENIRALPNRTVLAVTHRNGARCLCNMEYDLDGTGNVIKAR